MADADTSKRGTVVDEWVFWILTCAFSLYFVVLLLEFNRPSQKWMEQIDNQEVRRQDMRAALRTTHRMGSREVSTRYNIGFRLAMDADDIRPGS